MAAAGTKEYYIDLLNTANTNLLVYEQNEQAAKIRLQEWQAFKNKSYNGIPKCVYCCGRKKGCTEDDNASIQDAYDKYDEAVKILNDHKRWISLLNLAITGSTKPELQRTTAELEAMNEIAVKLDQKRIIDEAAKAEANKGNSKVWVPYAIAVGVVLLIIGIIIYIRRKK